MTGDLRKLRRDDVQDLHFLSYIIKVMTSGGGVGGGSGWECGTDMENFMADSFINHSVSRNFIFHSHHSILTINHVVQNVFR